MYEKEVVDKLYRTLKEKYKSDKISYIYIPEDFIKELTSYQTLLHSFLTTDIVTNLIENVSVEFHQNKIDTR